MSTDIQSNHDRVNAAIDGLTREIIGISDRIQITKWFRDHVAHLLPDEVIMSSSAYSYYTYDSLELNIPPVEGRPWRGMNGTAGLVYKVRKALGVKKFERETESAYGDEYKTKFHGRGEVDGKTMYIYVTLRNQLPDNCRIEWVEEVVPAQEATVRRRLKSVCQPVPTVTDIAVNAAVEADLSPDLQQFVDEITR